MVAKDLIHFQAEKFTGVLCKAMFFILVIFVFIILPPTLIYYVEDSWTYLDCVYYALVSLTTIGFGDLTIAQGEQEERLGTWMFAYKGFIVVWLIFGLGCTSMNNNMLAESIIKYSNKPGNFSIISLFMSILTNSLTKTDTEECEYDMISQTHTTRRVSDPCISFSARGHFMQNLLMGKKIARGRSVKIPPVITYDAREDCERLQIFNDMHNTELIDLRKKGPELQQRIANQGLQVTNSAAEDELISLRKENSELKKAIEGLQIANSVPGPRLSRSCEGKMSFGDEAE